MIGMSTFAGLMIKLCVLAALLLAALSWQMRKTSTGHRKVREGRVTGVVGRKGSGKTLFVTHELLRSLGRVQRCKKCSRDAGRDVTHPVRIASNGNLKLPPGLAQYYTHVTKWEDIVGVDDDGQPFFKLDHMTFVCIDEAHLFAPAKQGEQLPERVRWYLSQCRKGVQEVVWVTQHESRVALGLKVQTDEMGQVKVGYFGMRKIAFYEPEEFKRPNVKAIWVFRFKVTKRVGEAYDTYELIMPDSDEPLPVVLPSPARSVRRVKT